MFVVLMPMSHINRNRLFSIILGYVAMCIFSYFTPFCNILILITIPQNTK